MKKFIALFVTALFLFGAGCQNSGPGNSDKGYKDISHEKLQSMIEAEEDFLLVDVREEQEYAEWHIPSAILFPLGKLKEDPSRLDPQDTIVLVCRSDRRSGEAASFLVEQGYTSVYNLSGGMLAWPGQVERSERAT